jgi:hypothetical protein
MNNADFFAADALDFGHRDLGHPLVSGPVRLIDRMLARALGASLDQQLAAGCPPEATPLLAARAQRIVALPRRACLARSWDHLLLVARRAPARRSRAMPLRTAAILAAEPAIYELIARLTAPLPVGAQGVATATVLLTDPTSPVYSRRGPRTLDDLLHTAIIQLDPARPLMDAA